MKREERGVGSSDQDGWRAAYRHTTSCHLASFAWRADDDEAGAGGFCNLIVRVGKANTIIMIEMSVVPYVALL